jgi:hypothetical protein
MVSDKGLFYFATNIISFVVVGDTKENRVHCKTIRFVQWSPSPSTKVTKLPKAKSQ